MDATTVERSLFPSPRWTWTAGALGVILAVGLVDYATGSELTFAIFYLVPVAALAWAFGRNAVAICASALAAIVWFIAEFASRRVQADLFVYVWNFSVRLLFLMLVAVLLAQLRRMLERERALSRTDSLTGLPNSRAFREFADVELARARRYKHPLSLAFIDIDDFKRVNDRSGHRAGDRLLRAMADALRGSLRGSDYVARYGGDEFVVLLPVADRDTARATVEKLRERVTQSMAREGWPITLSIGVIVCEPGAADLFVDGLLESADRLMYEAKSLGKSGIRLATFGA
jgi:diguanylate cyclase (GGDEF)-like protein